MTDYKKRIEALAEYIDANCIGVEYKTGRHGFNYDKAEKAITKLLHQVEAETAKLNRIELAKDIKHRHWVNDKLRDSYLNAVIEVAQEELAAAHREES